MIEMVKVDDLLQLCTGHHTDDVIVHASYKLLEGLSPSNVPRIYRHKSGDLQVLDREDLVHAASLLQWEYLTCNRLTDGDMIMLALHKH